MNFKKLCFALVATMIVSCDQNNSIEPFDYAAQYVTEKPIVDEYLATHYFDDEDNEIKEIDDNQTALADDNNLQKLTATSNGVDYVMYSYVYEQGQNEDVIRDEEAVVRDVVGSPDADDIVNMSYVVSSLDGTFSEKIDRNDAFWNLSQEVKGWRIGLAVFRGGFAIEPDLEEPRKYSGTGKGFMIIPSGLTIIRDANVLNDQRTSNEALVFKIDLRLVVSAGEDL